MRKFLNNLFQCRFIKTNRFLLLSLLLATCYLLHATSLSAASPTFSLGVFPPIMEVIAKPGAKVKAKMRIINYADPASIKVYFQTFKPADELGNISFLSRTEEEDQAIDWLSLESASEIFPGEFNIGVSETRDFNLSLNIPKTAKEADHYLTIFFESLPFGNEVISHSKSQARIGSLLLLTVSDRAQIPKYGEITEFKAPIFVESGPVNFALQVKNNGRTFFKPLGSIKIFDTFKREAGEIEILAQNVLAGSTRRLSDKSILTIIKNQEKNILGVKAKKENFAGTIYNTVQNIFSFKTLKKSPSISSSPSLVFPRDFLIGRYTAVASFTLDEKGPTLTARTSFFAFPIRIALGIIITITLFFTIKKRLKS